MTREEKALVIEQIAAQLGEYPHFYITDIEALNAEQTESGCNSISYVTSLHEGLPVIFLLDYLVKHIESKHRHQYLKHDQNHGNCSELVVHRQMVEAELCECHEMISPCKED